MKILLDPCLLWFKEHPETNDNFNYLRDVVNFIEKYLNAKYFSSNEFFSILSKILKEPFGDYRETKQAKVDIIQKIWKNTDLEEIVNLDEECSSTYYDELMCSNSDYNDFFWKSINYMIRSSSNCSVFLSLHNHSLTTERIANVHYVKHIFLETNSYLGELFSNGGDIISKNFIQATKENPLPNGELCKRYSQIREKQIQQGEGDISFFLELGREVALRNGYIKDDYLTRINNGAIREIFRTKRKHTWYLSIDVEHGAIEVCDERGKHIDEYSYEGIPQDKHDNTGRHDIQINR